MKTILVPTDFSKNAENALAYAIQLAKKEEFKIILFHAFHYNYSGIDTSPEIVIEQSIFIQEGIEKRLKTLAKKTANKNHITCEYINEQGLLSDKLEDIVKKKKIDLIVMGTQGATGLKEIFMGSNTARVIANVTCPVIAVPAKSTFKKIKKIIYATDYQNYDIDALQELKTIATNFEANIEVLHIANGKFTHLEEIKRMEKFQEKVEKKIQSECISFNFLFGLEINDIIEEYLEETTINMIAVSTKQRGLFERIFGSSSITKKIVNHTKIPLIAFHHK